MRRRAGGAGRETERDGRMAIVEELEALREQTIAQIAQAADTAALEQVRIGVLGKAGTLTGYLRQMGQIAKEERAAVGKTANEVRAAVEGALAARKEELAASELAAAIDAAAVDVTLPGRSQQVGTRHLINRITDEISEIFLGLGYTVAEGPEVETDYYNFEALNAPADHPSRSLADTFYVVDRSGDEAAVRGLIKTCGAGPRPVRLAYIRDTLSLNTFWASAALAEELSARPDCRVSPESGVFRFDAEGSLVAPGWGPPAALKPTVPRESRS